MADNVSITPGTGATIGTDEVIDGTLGTVQIQFMKIMDGTLNSTNKAAVDASGNLTVKVNAALPAGSNVIGAVTQSGTWTVATNADGTIGAGTAPANSRIAGGIYNSTPITLTNGQGSALQIDSSGALYGNIRSWTVSSATLLGRVGIDQTTVGTTNAISLAQIGANTVSTGNGVAGTGCARVTIASDNTPFSINAVQSGTWTVATNADANTGAGTAPSKSVVGSGIAAVGANPIKATNGQSMGIAVDAIGRQIMVNGHERTMTGVQQTTITSSVAETTIITAGAAGVFNDITHLSITNGSATATIVTLKDATAGTTRGIWNLSAGGGVVLPFPTPLAQAAAANNWTITCGASVASVYVVAQFVKNS